MELFIIAASLVPASDSLNRILAPTPRVINHLCRVDQLAHIVQVRDRCLATRPLPSYAVPSCFTFPPLFLPRCQPVACRHPFFFITALGFGDRRRRPDLARHAPD